MYLRFVIVLLVAPTWTIEVLRYNYFTINTWSLCVRKMTLLSIFLNLAFAVSYKTLSMDFILFLKLC